MRSSYIKLISTGVDKFVVSMENGAIAKVMGCIEDNEPKVFRSLDTTLKMDGKEFSTRQRLRDNF